MNALDLPSPNTRYGSGNAPTTPVLVFAVLGASCAESRPRASFGPLLAPRAPLPYSHTGTVPTCGTDPLPERRHRWHESHGDRRTVRTETQRECGTRVVTDTAKINRRTARLPP
jgi:hypothetical protein